MTIGRLARAALALGAIAALTIVAALPAGAATEPTEQPPGLDHFECYRAFQAALSSFAQPAQITLKDDFGTATVTVGAVLRLCNPATVTRDDTNQVVAAQLPDAHLMCFRITQANFQTRKVRTTNQFGSALLEVTAPVAVCLPSFTNPVRASLPADTQPAGLDHVKCYSVRYADNPTDTFALEPPLLRSQDDFGSTRTGLGAPLLLCNPAEVTRTDGPTPVTTPATNPNAHLVCFRSDDDQQYDVQPWVKDQFGTSQVRGPQNINGDFRFTGEVMCLPSTRTAPK
jgi:hypothetical protein